MKLMESLISNKLVAACHYAPAIAFGTLVAIFATWGLWLRNQPLPTAAAETIAPAAPTPAVAAAPPAKYVPPAPPAKGHHQRVGFNGSLFRVLKPGDITGLEGGLMAMCAKDGAMWLIDAEPNDSREPLAKRQVYLACVSGELVAKRCGVWLPDFKHVPAACVEEELILPWKAAKKFMAASASNPAWVAEIEKFLEQRSRKDKE